MNSTRRTALAVCLTLALVAAACGGDDGSGGSGATPAPTTAPSTTLQESAPASEDPPAPTGQPTTTAGSEDPDPGEVTEPTEPQPVEPASGEPIRIGTMTTESGGLTITGNYEALSAFVAEYNAAGGFGGRPIEIVKVDAGLDPGTTAAAASELIEREGVVALVGNVAFVECIGSGALYESTSTPVLNVPLDSFCATNTQVFPLGMGSDTGVLPGVQWLVESREATSIAFVSLDFPQSRIAADLVAALATELGAELSIAEFAPFTGNPDIEGIASRVARARPDAIMSSMNEPLTEALVQALATQGIDIASTPMVVAAGLYTQEFLDLIGDAGEGMYLVDSFPLLDSNDPQTVEMLAALDRHIEEPTPDVFEQFGWMAGQVFVRALEALDGAEPTREHLTEALRTIVLEPGDVLLPATLDYTTFPIVTDPVPGFIARITNGQFVQVDGELILARVPTLE